MITNSQRGGKSFFLKFLSLPLVFLRGFFYFIYFRRPLIPLIFSIADSLFLLFKSPKQRNPYRDQYSYNDYNVFNRDKQALSTPRLKT